MNTKNIKQSIPVIIGVIVGLLVILGLIFFNGKNKEEINNTEDPSGSIDNVTSTSSDEGLSNSTTTETEQIPEEYRSFLKDAQEKIRDGKYRDALNLADKALKIYKNEQAYYVMYNAYSFMNDLKGKKVALKEIVETYGVLESRYWIDYADTLQQLGAPSSEIEYVYNDGLEKMKMIAKYGTGHMVDMHTAYARYFVSVEKYSNAIVELQKALELNPKRADIYNAEIKDLQSKL